MVCVIYVLLNTIGLSCEKRPFTDAYVMIASNLIVNC